jgi:hypothetical protein
VAGEALGHVVRTGVTYGTHVFFAVLQDGHAVDPLGGFLDAKVSKATLHCPEKP